MFTSPWKGLPSFVTGTSPKMHPLSVCMDAQDKGIKEVLYLLDLQVKLNQATFQYYKLLDDTSQ